MEISATEETWPPLLVNAMVVSPRDFAILIAAKQFLEDPLVVRVIRMSPGCP